MKDDLLLRIKRLRKTLLLSGILNIFLIFCFILWVKETAAPPIGEMKLTKRSSPHRPYLAEKSASDILYALSEKTIQEIAPDLKDKSLIENGFSVRDFALGSLTSIHHLDTERAFASVGKPRQRRRIAYADPAGKKREIVIFSDAKDEHFEAAYSLIRSEKWPVSPFGMYLKLLNTKEDYDPSLTYAFQYTKDFKTVELSLAKSGLNISSDELLSLILDGPFDLIKTLDLSLQADEAKEARREFLLAYVDSGSEIATALFLKSDFEYAVKRIDDKQAVKVLGNLTKETPHARQYALALLLSPRGDAVWEISAKKLYELSDEKEPDPLTRKAALARFAPVFTERKESEASPLPDSLKEAEEKKPKAVPIAEKTETPLKKSPEKEVPAPKPAKAPPQKSIATLPKKPVPQKKIAEAPAPKKKGKRAYIVQEGDTLFKVSKRFGVDPKEIREMNGLQSSYLKPGTLIRLP